MTTQEKMNKLTTKVEKVVDKYEEEIIKYFSDREKVEQILYDCFSELI